MTFTSCRRCRNSGLAEDVKEITAFEREIIHDKRAGEKGKG